MTQPDKTWTVKEALDWTRGYLERKEDTNPLLSARFLLSHATGLSHLELYTMFDRPLSLSEREVLRDAVARRGGGEPIQYITGKAPFRHLEVKVRPGVLIPRPETEVLVEEVLGFLQDAPSPLVADIGCGSGCISCAIAQEASGPVLWATDISSEACRLASENVEELHLQDAVHVVECDLDEGIPVQLNGMFDVMVSNPPYIPTAVMQGLPREVRDFEPALALEGGEDGLDVFRRLLDCASRRLKPQGLLAVELHEECLEAAKHLAEVHGFVRVRIVEDLASRPRILTALKGEDGEAWKS